MHTQKRIGLRFDPQVTPCEDASKRRHPGIHQSSLPSEVVEQCVEYSEDPPYTHPSLGGLICRSGTPESIADCGPALLRE